MIKRRVLNGNTVTADFVRYFQFIFLKRKNYKTYSFWSFNEYRRF